MTTLELKICLKKKKKKKEGVGGQTTILTLQQTIV
jgi:hypothetical protein